MEVGNSELTTKIDIIDKIQITDKNPATRVYILSKI